MTRAAYSYLRMSTETQLKGDSLRRQLEASQAYADKHNLRLVESLRDIGVSAFRGKNAKEGALATFLDAIREGQIEEDSILIIESLDRISRDEVLTAFELFSGILKAGITIVTLADQQTYTEESIKYNIGQLYTSLGIMFRANEESAIKSQRLKSAWSNKRSNLSNQNYTSVSPAWVQLNRTTQKFELIPDAAKAIRHIFNLCIDQGMGAYLITKEMNQSIGTYPPISKTNKWNKSYIMKILHNPAVHGEFQPHKQVNGKREPEGPPVPNYFPAVITKERFLLAQKRLSDRQNNGHGGGRKGATFNNIFTKLAKCGTCGANMTFKNRGKPPKGGKYLRCYNAESNYQCTCPAWQYDDFENIFFQFIKEIDISEIFKSDADKRKAKKLREDREITQKQIEDETKKYKNLQTNLELAPPEAIAPDLYGRLAEIKDNISVYQQREEKYRQQLAELESRTVEKSRNEAIALFKKANETLAAGERMNLRLKLHNHISRIIESITIYNQHTVHPWEFDDLPKASREILAQRGFITQEQLEALMDSAYGQRVVNESLRYFVVSFKNGTSRFVSPASGVSFKPKSTRMAIFEKSMATTTDTVIIGRNRGYEK